jgi:hypothetical protein
VIRKHSPTSATTALSHDSRRNSQRMLHRMRFGGTSQTAGCTHLRRCRPHACRLRNSGSRWTARQLLLAAVLLAGWPDPATFANPLPTPFAAAPQINDDMIDAVGDRVMQGNDFRSMRRRLMEPIPAADPDKGFLKAVGDQIESLFSGMFSAVGDFFDWLFSSNSQPRAAPQGSTSSTSGSDRPLDGVGRLLMVLMIIAILVLLTLIASLAVRARDRKRIASARLPDSDDDDLTALTVPPGELHVSMYEQRAVRYASQQNYRAAIRELLMGSMSWIERSGAIRFRRGLTNRDYLRAIWRQTDKRDAFAVVGLAFEQIYFGRRTATEVMYRSSLQAFQGAFREAATTNSVD